MALLPPLPVSAHLFSLSKFGPTFLFPHLYIHIRSHFDTRSNHLNHLHLLRLHPHLNYPIPFPPRLLLRCHLHHLPPLRYPLLLPLCRAALSLFHYLTHHRSFSPSDLSLSLSDLSDLSLSLLIHYFGRRHNFKVASLLSDHPHSIHAFISRLVSIGHPNQAIAFFEILDDKKTLSNLKILVGKLAEHKFALYVEHTVTKFVDKIFLNGGA